MLRARKRFGQHFLEPAWVARLVAAIDPAPGDTFLEIGPGRGAITRPLAAASSRVVAIEVDRDLARRLEDEALDRVEVVVADVLDVDLTALGLPAGTRVAGNLPYNLSTPILFRLLAAHRRTGMFRDATLMLQQEVVERIAAGPGSGDYGPLSIFTALEADVTRLLTLPPGAFRPAPAVTSAVVRLAFRAPADRPPVPDVFGPLVRQVFTQRRKMLQASLRPFAEPRGLDWRAALSRAGVDGRRRPESLALTEWLDLASAFDVPPQTSSVL